MRKNKYKLFNLQNFLVINFKLTINNKLYAVNL